MSTVIQRIARAGWMLLLSVGLLNAEQRKEGKEAMDMQLERIDGSVESLGDHKGKLLLIVNTASECGLTPQYKGLQELHESYADRGLRVMGFPCNEFGAQEPGSSEQIRSFCSANYGVDFPMYAKVRVLGEDAHPLFRWLKAEAPEGKQGEIQWNFNKFLVDGEGKVVDRFEPTMQPQDETLIARIEELLPE